ncbi:hypothetical protein LINGRAHAP2_LOCUS18617 [Linum grandiflorum]
MVHRLQTLIFHRSLQGHKISYVVITSFRRLMGKTWQPTTMSCDPSVSVVKNMISCLVSNLKSDQFKLKAKSRKPVGFLLRLKPLKRRARFGLFRQELWSRGEHIRSLFRRRTGASSRRRSC